MDLKTAERVAQVHHEMAERGLALKPPVDELSDQLGRLSIKAVEAGVSDAAADLDRMCAASARLQALIAALIDSPQPAAPDAPAWLAAHEHLRHDLRTPLNAVKGYGELLMDDWQDGGAGSLMPHLQQVIATANQLLSMIDDR
jgi:signal transduction histidine kinase